MFAILQPLQEIHQGGANQEKRKTPGAISQVVNATSLYNYRSSTDESHAEQA
jgi:hypothetical protein